MDVSGLTLKLNLTEIFFVKKLIWGNKIVMHDSRMVYLQIIKEYETLNKYMAPEAWIFQL